MSVILGLTRGSAGGLGVITGATVGVGNIINIFTNSKVYKH